VWIGVLGLLGVLVPLIRDIAHIGKREKAIWTFVIFTLLLLEIKSVYQDRDEHDREQAEVRERETKSFETIANGISSAIQQNQQHFDKTLDEMQGISSLSAGALRLSSKALLEITGGGQYCYLTSMPTGMGTINLVVMNSGPLPLERCLVSIHENVPIKSAEDAERNFRPLVFKELGPVSPGPKQGITTGIILPIGSYYIQIYTRNDRFYETLTVNPDYPRDASKGYETIEVRDDKWKLLYSQPEAAKP
jgi:hypothetical protein